MGILEFMAEHPVLTWLVLGIIAGAIADLYNVKIMSDYHKIMSKKGDNNE